MVRKKRGASLVSVVIISGIIITVGTAMLSMTVGDYKARINESSRIKNLYSSESGLDVAHDILIKTFDTAVKYSVDKVEDYKKSDDFITNVAKELKTELKDKQDEKIQISQSTSTDKKKQLSDCNKAIDELNKQIKVEEDKAIDAYFKEKFNDFVYMNQPQQENSTITEAPVNTDEIRKCIEGKKYIANVGAEGPERYSTVNLYENGNSIIQLSADLGYDENNEKYTIKITSVYTTSDKNGTNERKLQSVYDMTVPNYKDVAFSESNAELANYTFLNDKVLTIGGNMTVNDTNLSTTGNVFVQGSGDLTNNVSTRVYDKYNGGIVLNAGSDKKVEFTGEVVTGKTFNIRNNIKATINGSLYAMNVYAGSEKESDSLAHDSTLDVKTSDNKGEVVVDNDITLKADNTTMTMDKFYGINDKNILYDEKKGVNTSSEPLGRTASSIIVNGHAGSNIIVNQEAYIMGVAHINTNTPEGYTTGESTGVNGNYIAYAYPTDDNSEKFNYFDPLQLLDENNILKKSKHFVDYWNSPGKLDSVDTGGIKLPEGTMNVNGIELPRTCSIGAIVYKDLNNKTKVLDSTYNLTGIPDVVRVKQRDFASKVYNIGGEQLSDTDKQTLYESLGASKDKVEDLMMIDNTLPEYIDKNEMFFKVNGSIEDTPDEESNNEKAIFSDKNIKIQSSSTSNIINNGEDSITINVANGDKLNAFIATTGNVSIEGEVNFEGSIIAKGDLNISGVEGKTINYNKDLLDRIVASNSELFNSVFGHMRQDTTNSGQQSSQANITVDYDRDKFIKDRIWKIVK